MLDIDKYISSIFQPKLNNFDEIALQVFKHQYKHNIVYNKYCNLLHKNTLEDVDSVAKIPFMPIDFFKTNEIKTGVFFEEMVFSSSSTSGIGQSFHYVKNLKIYKKSFLYTFEKFYGNPNQYCIFALLPSYLERQGSSLVFMLDELIRHSCNKASGFYLNNHSQLCNNIMDAMALEKKIILFGATFGLLDFAESQNINISNAIVIETGGMKGRREELTRQEIHNTLQNKFKVKHIQSEYGMTELLSQAYAIKDGIFECPPWMSVIITEINDPNLIAKQGKTGVINVIDLANIFSCSFIKTSDIGKQHANGTFEVLGRIDNSDLRGCSLLTV